MAEAMKNVRENGKNTEFKKEAIAAVEDAIQPARRLYADAKELIGEQAPQFLRQGFDRLQTNTKRVLETSEQAMRRNIWYSVLGAAGAGLVLGVFLFRSRKSA